MNPHPPSHSDREIQSHKRKWVRVDLGERGGEGGRRSLADTGEKAACLTCSIPRCTVSLVVCLSLIVCSNSCGSHMMWHCFSLLISSSNPRSKSPSEARPLAQGAPRYSPPITSGVRAVEGIGAEGRAVVDGRGAGGACGGRDDGSGDV